MLVKVLGVLALVGAVHMASLTELKKQEKQERQFNIVDVFTFNNKQCTSTTDGIAGEEGTCKTATECSEEKGIPAGACAKGFGVCCLKTGDITIGGNGGRFRSRKCDSDVACPEPGVYTADLNPPEGTKQVHLEFTNFELAPPEAGDCGNDTFVVVGANEGENIPVLCGSNTGQHMYFNIDNSDGPYKLLVTLSDADLQRSWDTRVKYLKEFEAPPNCLQYYTEEKGDIKSFNYGDYQPISLNNQHYSACFGYRKGKCDIEFKFDRFDLGDIDGNCEGDSVTVESQPICGDIDHFKITAKANGPIFITVETDDENVLEEEGFSGSYKMLKC